MRQGILPFEYVQVARQAGGTALGGLPLFMELACAIRLWSSIEEHVDVCSEVQGWTNAQLVMSLIMLNLAGGDCVDDIRILEHDEGFCRVWRMAEHRHLSRTERAEAEDRFRRGRTRTLPAQTSIFRFLESFHDAVQEGLRVIGKAFIPTPNAALAGLASVNSDLVAYAQFVSPKRTATLDMDATVIETYKKEALPSYKGFRAYQPINVYWAEHGMVLHSEFRDGNVPAGHQQLRVFEEALARLPADVETVYLRSDTAGYQWELLHYCARGENERFGRIGFAVGCDVTETFRDAARAVAPDAWQPVYRRWNGMNVKTDREWAEVCYVPEASVQRRNDPDYHFIAIRDVLQQPSLPEMSDETTSADQSEQLALPFSTVDLSGEKGTKTYKLFGLVTNLEWNGGRVVSWLHERCGKAEEVHSVQKEDMAGGTLPSGDFGANAAWWQIMNLALNLTVVMKRLVLGDEWANRRMKALRFRIINLPGSFVTHAHRVSLKLTTDPAVFAELVAARKRIAEIQRPPP
jgi:hypothetical protein